MDQVDQTVKRQAQALLAQGKKIVAIKLIRKKTGWLLREAKEYVDKLEPVAGPIDPIDPSFDQLTAQLDDFIIHEARILIERGRKIDAIKLVRQHTNWGLKQAKAYVDQLEGIPLRGDAATHTVDQASGSLEMEARNLVARGKKIMAIKLVRQKTGMGLREAKEYVDRL